MELNNSYRGAQNNIHNAVRCFNLFQYRPSHEYAKYSELSKISTVVQTVSLLQSVNHESGKIFVGFFKTLSYRLTQSVQSVCSCAKFSLSTTRLVGWPNQATGRCVSLTLRFAPPIMRVSLLAPSPPGGNPAGNQNIQQSV